MQNKLLISHKHSLPYLVTSLLDIYTRETKSRMFTQALYTNVHSNFICNNQKPPQIVIH